MTDLTETDLAQIRKIVREELLSLMGPPILLVPEDSVFYDDEGAMEELMEATKGVIIRGPRETLSQIKGFGPTTVTMIESEDDL